MNSTTLPRVVIYDCRRFNTMRLATAEGDWSRLKSRLETKESCISFWPTRSVTRFGEMKFRHFGKTFNVFGNYFRVYFVLGKILNLIRHILRILGKWSSSLLSQYLRDNLAVWSCCGHVRRKTFTQKFSFLPPSFPLWS